ncbi:YggT family protein [Patulibacter sp. S7RM1-6]
MTTALVVASARTQVADFLLALVEVYTILIVAWVLVSLVQSAGVRIPYNRGTSAVLRFLGDAVEPYVGLFRRILPTLGPFDLSPLVALLVLQIVGQVVVNLVHG